MKKNTLATALLEATYSTFAQVGIGKYSLTSLKQLQKLSR